MPCCRDRSFQGLPATQVWASNFVSELQCLALFVRESGACVIAFDVEFPGCFAEVAADALPESQYQMLRSNVNLLDPIQVGFVVAAQDGSVIGSWDFNLHFNLQADLHTGCAVALLRAAGMDFDRHCCTGIGRQNFRWLFVESFLPTLETRKLQCQFVTFAGAYDYGYVLKLLFGPLPLAECDFVSLVDRVFPCRCELRDCLPYGSLGSLASEFGISRSEQAHCAASDALVALRLYEAAVVAEHCGSLRCALGSCGHWQVRTTMFRHPPGLCSVSGAAGVKKCSLSVSWVALARSEACHGIGSIAPTHAWCGAAREALSAAC